MSSFAIPRDRILEPVLRSDLSVKLIGAGGVGGIVARYGAIYCASLDSNVRFVLIDGDEFEASNGTRMFFGRQGNKAEVIREELLPRFTESRLSLMAIDEYVSRKNITRLIHNGDIVLLTVDNHATRKLVSEYCAKALEEVCLISGGNDGVGKDASGRMLRGTYGSVQIYLRRAGRDVTPALTRNHPEIQQPADRLPTEKSCTELITSVPQILFTNLMVASALLNAFWLYLCDVLHYGELALDIADGLMRPTNPLLLPNLPSSNVRPTVKTAGRRRSALPSRPLRKPPRPLRFKGSVQNSEPSGIKMKSRSKNRRR